MEKINIAEILKDCPKGMELDCTLLDNVEFEKLDFNSPTYPIVIRNLKSKALIHLSKYGQFVNEENYKCVIFPKGKNTWEGFVPPREFKDGDIVATSKGDYVFMLKKARIYKDDDVYNVYNGTCYFGLSVNSEFLFKEESEWYFNRLATEEEKQKLFDAIKSNGYKWNEETKTLEKLIEPKFKVGNKIKEINSNEDVVLITDITDDYYIVETEYCMKVAISMNMQNNYELVPNKFDISTLVPFESKVLVRDNKTDAWKPAYWGFYDETNITIFPYETVGGNCFSMCIPYKGNEHLLGKTDNCNDFYKTWM